jgi:hypothetical protein
LRAAACRCARPALDPGLRSGRRAAAGTAVGLVACFAARLVAQPTIVNDPRGDVVTCRTDVGGTGVMNPQNTRLPDILETRVGAFAPTFPHFDLFYGSWSSSGGFMRFDLVLAGLINPPGMLEYDDDNPTWNPFKYGPNPIFGWIEIDIDNDVNTGCELNNPELRYLGNIARMGGLPPATPLGGRFAIEASAFDHNILTPPCVERSGEEFHLALYGEEVESIEVRVSKPGGHPSLFESGEVWVLHGSFWHRAHGFEPFAFTCLGKQGKYKPDVQVRFAHDLVADRTTISLVYPLTNAAAATMDFPCPSTEPNDGCPGNQNSIAEALDDLQYSAVYADPFDRTLPEFQPIAGWELRDIPQQLTPSNWRIDAVVGTAYLAPQNCGARFIWTDAIPSARVGDFNGDGLVDANDLALLDAYIESHDGVPAYDADGIAGNGRVVLPMFAQNFSVFDTNYDGIVEPADGIVLGDMDIDGTVGPADVDDFVQAIVAPALYSATHGGRSPVPRGDLNADGQLDGLDISPFVQLILGTP